MTTRCGGGTSGAKVGVAAVVDYSSGLIASILAARGLGWLIPVIPLAGLPPLILSAFCATDPPTVPTFTSAETNALLQLTFGADFDSGLTKLSDLFLNIIWEDACQCTSGALVPFTNPSPPSGTPITVFPPGTTHAPCQRLQHTDYILAGASVVTYDMPAASIVGALVQLTGASPAQSAAQSCTFEVRALSSGGTNLGAVAFTVLQANQGVPVTRQFVVPATTDHLQLRLTSAGNTGQVYTFYSDVQVFCDGVAPTPGSTPCCVPDPATQSYLESILKMVTLIQRQAVPFAYLTGSVHTALSGSGSISISGLLGASAHCTTIPASYGRAGTTPTEYFGLGFITFGTPDGFPTAYKLERETLLMLPARCSAYTQIDYDLAPGVVVTLTELVREP